MNIRILPESIQCDHLPDHPRSIIMSIPSIRSEAHRIVDELPDDATWDDLMYHLQVRQCIEAGLLDSEQGRVLSEEQLDTRMGLPS